jgi:MFS family permease
MRERAGEVNFLTEGMTIPTRRLLAVALLFSSSFAWFFVFYTYFDEFVSPGSVGSLWHTAGLVALLASIVASAFIGSAIAGKANRRKLLLLCLIAGIIITVPILFFQGDEFLVIWGTLAGLSFGIGFPSCQAFLSDSTAPEERGRVAGLVILLTFVLVAFSSILLPMLNLGPIGVFLLLLGIKSIGFLSFALDPINRVENMPKPWRSVLGYRDFNFYSLAFVLFMVAAGLVSLLWEMIYPGFDAAYQTATLVRLLGLCIFALTAGLVGDRIGRKKPIIFGLVMLAAAYALVGLQTTSDVFLVTYVLSGFAWGMIMVVYLMVPGDLAFAGSAERFYAVGWVFPLILYISVEAASGLFDYSGVDISIFAYVLSLILFAAILPLWSAVETLSESKMRERKLKEHAEKVSKVIQESQETDQE